MSAKHGLTRSFRLLGCLMAVALLGSALFASVASAKKTPPTNKTAYIALGDSVSYGYSQQKFAENFPAESPSAFEGGLVNLFAAKLAKKEAKEGNLLETANVSCPGEASAGLFGNGPLASALISGGKISKGEAPCGWHNGLGLPRHYEFGGVSQLEAVKGLIEADKAAEPEIPVKAVTLQIGSNDELHKLGECESEAYRTAHGFAGFIQCVEEEAKKTLFPTIINNIGVAIGVIRSTGYTGPVILFGFYNPQAQLVVGSDLLQGTLNTEIEKAIERGDKEEPFGLPKGTKYANPFKKTNPFKKGIVVEHEAICKYTEECNEFDKKLNLIASFESVKGGSHTHEEAVEKATPEAVKAYQVGDIHPSPEGHQLFAKLLWKAFTH
jgi:lysophospholipase L1-like esterase